MSNYTYDPDTLDPVLSGLAAGGVAALFAAAVAIPLKSPDEVLANSVSITVVSLLIGLATGALWRRLRATSRATTSYWIAVGSAWFIAMIAVTIIDQAVVRDLVPYATPVATVIFLTVGLLTPPFSQLHVPAWTAAIPVVAAAALGLGLI